MKGNIMDPDNPQSGPDNSNVSVVDAEGNFVENWADRYNEEDRPTLSRFTNIDDFVKSHMSNRRMFNKDPDTLVEIPGENTSDEERADFHRRRGVPDEPTGYKYEQPETIPENLRSDAEEMAFYFQLAKSADLTEKQLKIMADGHFENLGKRYAAQDLINQDNNRKENAAAEATLKKKFGKAYDERVARANAVMQHYSGVGAVDSLKLENNPLMVEFIDNIAEDMSEDRIKGITTTTIATTAALDNRISELRNHPAYNNSSHPEHKKVQAECQELYKQRYPA